MLSALWEGLVSIRLTLALLSATIVLLLMGIAIGQDPTAAEPLGRLYSSEVLYAFRLLGLTDIFHSAWFILALTMLALNLVCNAIDRLPAVWRHASQKVPAALNIDQVMTSRRAEKHFYVHINSTLGREAFRELVNEWSRKQVGKPHAVRDEGGFEELQIVAQQGRFTRPLVYLTHFAVLLVLAGALWGAFSRFEARVTIDEGGRAQFVQVLRGRAEGWKPFLEKGKPVAGFFVPSFDIEATRFEAEFYPGTERPRRLQTTLGFIDDGKIAGTRAVSVNQPASFEGFTFHQMGFSRTGQLAAFLKVKDLRAPKDAAPIPLSLGKEEQSELPDGVTVRVLDVQETTPDYGPSAELEVTWPEQKETDRFWVFRDYPGFEAAKRKRSRFHFELAGLKERYATTLAISRDPGMALVWVGFAVLALALILSLKWSHNRYWFIWHPGKVSIIAWSNRLFLFEPQFERSMENFRKKMAKLDRTVKGTHLEVQHGSL